MIRSSPICEISKRLVHSRDRLGLLSHGLALSALACPRTKCHIANPGDAAMSTSGAASTPAPLKQVKFVASDPTRGGLPVKRKQISQACDACRRKKRRCLHTEQLATDDSVSAADDQHGHNSSPSQASPATLSSLPTPRVRQAALPAGHGINHTSSPSDMAAASSYARTPRPPHDASMKPQSSRFVGDLNPEAMFVEAAHRQQSQNGDVGIWLSSAASGTNGQLSQFITSRPPPMMDRFLLPFVREHCLSFLPPEEDFAKIRAIFINKIHPIFPVISINALGGSLENPCNVVLRQLVCMSASTDPESSQYLRLRSRGQDPLPSNEYSQSLSSAVRAILETSIITDRVLHIQALVLLSLYTQPTCAEEADLPAQFAGRAIHHIHTLGLHLLRYDAPNCDDLNNLFCVVWALDRINAAVYGRPCLIHERDIGADLEACIKKRPPCFRLFLSVVQWLDQVIELYRPGPSAEVSGLNKIAYIDLPVLEAMIVDADALNVPSSLISTIEVLYHAVVVLSCRLPRPGTMPAASTLPPPSANARRSLAAERIACAVPRDHLSPMPFVPYAVSLALSVEYRKMRHSRLPMFRARSMKAFKRNCELLRKFGGFFWSANVVAGLGERVLREMERAASSLTKEASPPRSDAESRPPLTSQEDAAPARQPEMAVNSSTAVNSIPGMDNAVDLMLVDEMSGQDVFSHIDPNFNLDAVEDALEANLDISLPLNWGDWSQFAT
ncbi:fungal specific transcription factor [Hirsutella rhossiliensis]|uniref:Fungal specific transcription factor domain-containing protein n=1 Tax=Hirsutella rhossiliensis TaxID=111463 RepID=A0A9P8SEQ0_9HYPO|nr:fungal specific transcription factor domain-containing protein [Hirsutella rhossiliensis]KAH0958266.1 fungal specific transcription factor domain-containing protein [Hirsutella rhossiliensis]